MTLSAEISAFSSIVQKLR